MKFNELLRIVGNEPVFSSALLYAGLQSPGGIQAQISRWVKEGKIIKLRRRLYAVNPEYSGVTPDPLIVANSIVVPSYVSCQTALAWHGVIPEAVSSVTSITSGRSCTFSNPAGTFIYRHVKPELLWGFEKEGIPGSGSFRIAFPEKALLDLVYLEPAGDSFPYLSHLRMSEGSISVPRLRKFAGRWGRKKIARAAENIIALLAMEAL